MNLFEALKQKLPIGRPSWVNAPNKWPWVAPEFILETLEHFKPFSKEDFLADDWVIKQPELTTPTGKTFVEYIRGLIADGEDDDLRNALDDAARHIELLEGRLKLGISILEERQKIVDETSKIFKYGQDGAEARDLAEKRFHEEISRI